MRMRSVLLGGISVLATVAVAASAQAGTVYNATINAPVVYGSGNDYTPENFAVTTDGGIQIGLRSHIRGDVAPSSIGDLYVLAAGAPGVGFDFTYDPSAFVGTLPSLTANIHIDNLGNGHSYDFNPALIGDDARPNGGFQNSEALAYFNGLFPTSALGYSANANDTYRITYTVSGAPTGQLSVTNTIQIGSGAAVPEPATWAMMILGMGGLGAAMRRRRHVAAAATA